MKRFLFVCTGNICRSPAADAVLRERAVQAGLDVVCDSAATHAYHVGDAPDHRNIAVGAERGYDLSPLRARKVQESDFREFDVILAMDTGHYDILAAMRPHDATAELVMFMEYCQGRPNIDVPDPYYGDLRDFEVMYDIIEDGISALVEKNT